MIYCPDSHIDQTTIPYTGCNIMLLLFLFMLILLYNRGGHIQSIKLLLNVLVFVFTCDDDETNEAASLMVEYLQKRSIDATTLD
jgi:hypothetical protein